MAHAVFAPGAVLGERFELHGVVGRGGTAEVWLATDRLRGERVALKLVHAHLTADPATRRRLQREVQTASVLRSSAALVPHDLHDLGGVLALSMPFHPGQTLTERVATGGALPPDEVRALGVRVASALADAHRVGVLHRDVTANNVLVGDRVEDSVLTDFGLSRLLGSTRSTGLLGTAGYAAPEVYEGQRADPRSDLYGLGAVLYLAVTGKPAFDPKDPVGSLKRQLESPPRVRDRAPACPADLADLIESLLRPAPGDRPQGAREVLDALVHGGRAPASEARPASAGSQVVARKLPSGSWTVIVRERSDDRGRRERNRRKALGVAPSAEDEIARWGRLLLDRLRDAVGMEAGPEMTPEEALHLAVCELAGAPPTALRTSRVLLERKFRLVDATDEETANHLVNRASALGFRAEAVELAPDAAPQLLFGLWLASMIAGWIAAVGVIEQYGSFVVPLMVAYTVFGGTAFGRRRRVRERDLRTLGVAYPVSLAGLLTSGAAVAPTPAETAAPQAEGRGASLRDRALAAIASAERTATEVDLPDVARADLATSFGQLRARAASLGAEVERLEGALAGRGDGAGDVAGLRVRFERLAALERAGERVDERERRRIEQALAAHAADEEAADRLESELTAATAALLELASSASRVRRELAATPDRRSADEAVARLSREARAAVEARRELESTAARRAARASRAVER